MIPARNRLFWEVMNEADMNLLDPGRTYILETVPAGTVVARRGDAQKQPIILHSGFLEALAGSGKDGDSSPLGLRVGFAQGPTVVGVTTIFDANPRYRFTLRAVTECVVTLEPDDHISLEEIAASQPQLFQMIISAASRHFGHARILFQNYQQLWNMIRTIGAGLAMGVPVADGTPAPGKLQMSGATLEQYAASLKSRLSESNRAKANWNPANFSPGTQQDLLATQFRETSLEKLIDRERLDFIAELVNHQDGAVIPVIASNTRLAEPLYRNLASSLNSILDFNMKVAEKIDALLDQIYGPEGWCDQARSLLPEPEGQSYVFFHEMSRCSLALRKPTAKLMGVDPTKKYPGYYGLRDFSSTRQLTDDKRPETDVPLQRYHGLLGKLLDFAGMDDSFREAFIPMMEEFGKDPRPEQPHEELSGMFWTLYETCFLKAVATDLKAFVPGVFLHLGLVDERLLDSDQLAEVDRCYRDVLYRDDPVPVMTLPYFLERIYSGDVGPSTDEMGMSFAELLQSQTKKTTGTSDEYQYRDNPDDRVRYEIRRVAVEIQGLLFGNRKKSIPFLHRDFLKTGTARNFARPDSVDTVVRRFRERDFSLFYREVLVNGALGKEFVQLEVIPYFILYPGVGSRMMMWQEMDGRKKSTSGRLFLPIIFDGRFDDSLSTQLAEFRWAMGQASAGNNWTDPIEGGLVGAYYDYITYFRKNTEISAEAKERLASFVRKTKSEKERFSIDYLTWVDSEFNGMMKLTQAARAIFYKFCPFPVATRRELAARPAYETLETRFIRNRDKEKLKLKSRILKYEKQNKAVPEEVRSYAEFLSR